jgi:hypothetical protein
MKNINLALSCLCGDFYTCHEDSKTQRIHYVYTIQVKPDGDLFENKEIDTQYLRKSVDATKQMYRNNEIIHF